MTNKEMKKDVVWKFAMISQPMNGITEEEIKKTRAIAGLKLLKKGYLVADSCIKNTKNRNNESLWYLAKSLEIMSECDAVYFCKGWKNARECRIEHEAAKAYGLKLIEEK